MTLVIENRGLSEPGLAGVRVATTSGLVMETDAFGRYHLAGMEGPPLWGRNEVFKVDETTLPEGATFTTENPRVVQLTPGLMTKVNFGVQLPVLPVPEKIVSVKLGEVFFEAGEDAIRPDSLPVIDQMAEPALRREPGAVAFAMREQSGHAERRLRAGEIRSRVRDLRVPDLVRGEPGSVLPLS